MKDKSRRGFIKSTGKLLVGTAALGTLNAFAAEEHRHAGAGDGHVMDATAEKICATCQFWGGMRKVSEDKRKVIVQSMGWCNNPNSPNYQKLTAPDHEMKKVGIWKKWTVL